MKKQIITIITTAIIVSLLDFGIFYLCKNMILNNDNTSDPKENKKFTSNGTYVITYTDKAEDLKENIPSILTIKKDKTYTFLYNRCDAMITVKGTYKINNNTLTLDYPENAFPFNDKDVTFTILNDNEIYLDEQISCTVGKDAYDNGYASFKKIN